MDLQKFGLTGEQQARIDGDMLDLVLTHLAQGDGRVPTETVRDELEAVYHRAVTTVLEQTCTQLPASLDGSVEPSPHPVSPQVLTNLGKLSFVDSLGLPSTEKVGRKSQELPTVEFCGHAYRRLFAGVLAPEA